MYAVSSIQPKDRALSGAIIPGQSEPGSNDNEEVVLCIPQSSSITGASSSDHLVSYPGHLSGRSLTPHPPCRGTVGVFYSPADWANVVWKTSQERWTMRTDGARETGKSVLAVRLDDHDSVLICLKNNSCVSHLIYSGHLGWCNGKQGRRITFSFSVSNGCP